jgi:hypothetical protein
VTVSPPVTSRFRIGRLRDPFILENRGPLCPLWFLNLAQHTLDTREGRIWESWDLSAKPTAPLCHQDGLAWHPRCILVVQTAPGDQNMVLKIERRSEGKCLVLRLSGRMQAEHVEQLKTQMEGSQQVALDLEDVKLVDRDVVHFLGECEANGAELRRSSPYIREWILKERTTRGGSESK